MRFRISVSLLIAALFLSTLAFLTQEVSLTDSQRALVALDAELDAAYKAFWSKFEVATSEQRLAMSIHDDPIKLAAEQLLTFEHAHRGKLEGLMALRVLISNASRGGPIDGPRDQARRSAIDRLHHYVSFPEVVETVSYLNFGNPDTRNQDVVRELIKAAGSENEIGANLRIELCNQLLSNHHQYDSFSERCIAIENGSPEAFKNELNGLKSVLSELPSSDFIEQELEVAMSELKLLSRLDDSFRTIVCQPLGRYRCIVEVANSQHQSAPRVSDAAAGILFRESLLQGGVQNELKVTLMNGTTWKSADHRGKFLLIQFSTIPCFPCEQMYLEINKLDSSDQFECLTLFRSTPQEAQKKMGEADIDWSVACLAEDDPLLTQFAVKSFPTAFFVSREGAFQELGHTFEASVLMESLGAIAKE